MTRPVDRGRHGGSGRPEVSALVVSFNAGANLRRCLEHLRDSAEFLRAGRVGQAAPRPTLEAVVVDNASSDGSAATAREFGQAGAEALPVRLIQSRRNVGFGAACNLAALEARGRYLLLLNPDAWIDGPSLLRLVDAAEADDRLAVAAPALHYPDGSPQFGWAPPVGVFGEAIQKVRNRCENAGCSHDLLPRLLRSLVGAGWYTAACLLVRRSAFEAVGGFDEGFFLYFEDADMCLRLQRAGFRLRGVAGARAWHVRGAVTGGGRERRLTPTAERYYRASQLRYYDLHRPRWERLYLRRRLRRKFRRVADEEQRTALLRLLDGS